MKQSKYRVISHFSADRDAGTSVKPARLLVALVTGLAVVGAGTGSLVAAPIPVPNGSFESQVADPATGVNTEIDSWQKAAQPGYFDPAVYGFSWDQTAGVFANTVAGQANHIDNMDGNQGAYLLAFPQVGFFQDANSTDWNHTSPTHAFNPTFQVGRNYQLTVGVIGGGGGMPTGDTLDLILYYVNGENAKVTVGETTVTYTPGSFPTTTHLIDETVNLPAVQAGDPEAGQNIGIEVVSDQGTGAGYWDIDNVRLVETPEPGTLSLMAVGFGGLIFARSRRRK